jgi:hypothetical protein
MAQGGVFEAIDQNALPGGATSLSAYDEEKADDEKISSLEADDKKDSFLVVNFHAGSSKSGVGSSGWLAGRLP